MAGPEAQPPERCDVAIVGGGILGLAVARELLSRRPDASVAVLEKEPELGFHQTGHNSGVIHGGIYYKPGSLKARLCVEGARDMYDYCDRRAIHAQRIGKLILATEPGELPALGELERRAVANGVPDVRRVGPDEIAEIEPHARGIAGLHSPGTGLVDFRAVALAFADDVRAAGGAVAPGAALRSVRAGGSELLLSHERGQTVAGHAIFCAGAWSDRLAEQSGASADPRIVPFRGAYLRLRRDRTHLVRSLVYPVPDPRLPFLGVHFSRHSDEEVLVGPTALLVGARDAYRLRRVSGRDIASTLSWPGTWRMMGRFWRTGLDEIRSAASRRALAAAGRRYIPELDSDDLVQGPAGIRAQAVARDGSLLDDFAFSYTPRALHVRNAPSPGATASLALARVVVDRAQEDLGL